MEADWFQTKNVMPETHRRVLLYMPTRIPNLVIGYWVEEDKYFKSSTTMEIYTSDLVTDWTELPKTPNQNGG